MSGSDPTLELSFRLTLDDYRALQRRMLHQQQRDLATSGWAKLALWLVLAAIFVLLAQSGWFQARHLAVLLGALAVAWAYASVVSARQRAYWDPLEDGAWLGPQHITLSADGIRIVRTHSDGMLRWPAVLRVDETPTHLFLMVDSMSALVIPKQTAVELGVERLAEFVRAHVTPR